MKINAVQFSTLRPPAHHETELTVTSCAGILIESELTAFMQIYK